MKKIYLSTEDIEKVIGARLPEITKHNYIVTPIMYAGMGSPTAGEELVVKEQWRHKKDKDGKDVIRFRSTEPRRHSEPFLKWNPARTMPEDAPGVIVLRVESVKEIPISECSVFYEDFFDHHPQPAGIEDNWTWAVVRKMASMYQSFQRFGFDPKSPVFQFHFVPVRGRGIK